MTIVWLTSLPVKAKAEFEIKGIKIIKVGRGNTAFDEKSLKRHLQAQEEVTSKIYSNINYTLIDKLFKESNIKI